MKRHTVTYRTIYQFQNVFVGSHSLIFISDKLFSYDVLRKWKDYSYYYNFRIFTLAKNEDKMKPIGKHVTTRYNMIKKVP